MKKTSLPKEDWPGRFDESHYDLLLESSGRKDFNEWRSFLNKLNDNERILLEGAYLSGAYLAGAELYNAKLTRANLNGVNLSGANLIRTDLKSTNLTGADLTKANMFKPDLSGAILDEADLSGARMNEADLSKTRMNEVNLFRVTMNEADLSGAYMRAALLNSAKFHNLIVDGQTLISECVTDDDTDFTGVGLGNIRIEPQLKSSIESNIRRLWWRANYRWWSPVSIFWLLSDYGRSTYRILAAFAFFTLLFAFIYWLNPTMITHLLPENGETGNLFIRSLYFSVVTMTTLGFGDMFAAIGNNIAYFVLMCHVIIGYTILAALVVRLGILFSSVPPEHREKK